MAKSASGTYNNSITRKPPSWWSSASSPKPAVSFPFASYLHVFWYFGIAEDIVSDSGPQFTSRVWKAFCELLQVKISLTSVYHPRQANIWILPLSRPFIDLVRATTIKNGDGILHGLNMCRTLSINPPRAWTLSSVCWLINLPYFLGLGWCSHPSTKGCVTSEDPGGLLSLAARLGVGGWRGSLISTTTPATPSSCQILTFSSLHICSTFAISQIVYK